MSRPSAEDVRLATALVTDAGRLAARMRAEGVSVETKTSISDLVTAADKAAEAQVVARLAAERPGDGILGEEGASADSTTGRRWVIDPVDGTYNFVRGLTWWCSALALMDGEELVLGAVYHPHDDAVYVGGPDLPTTCNGEPVAGVGDVPLSYACVVTYLHPARWSAAVGEAYDRVVSRVAAARVLGSGSMDMTAVAQGQLDVYCQHSVPDWDLLPGAALVLGAGGVVDQVEAGGVLWSLAGAPTAVAEAKAALVG